MKSKKFYVLKCSDFTDAKIVVGGTVYKKRTANHTHPLYIRDVPFGYVCERLFTLLDQGAIYTVTVESPDKKLTVIAVPHFSPAIDSLRDDAISFWEPSNLELMARVNERRKVH